MRPHDGFQESDWHARAAAGKASQKKRRRTYIGLVDHGQGAEQAPIRVAAVAVVRLCCVLICKGSSELRRAKCVHACGMQHQSQLPQSTSGDGWFGVTCSGTHGPTDAWDGAHQALFQQRGQSARIMLLRQPMRPSRLRSAPNRTEPPETWPTARADRRLVAEFFQRREEVLFLTKGLAQLASLFVFED